MLSRREFLKRGVVVVSAGLALPPVFTKAVHAAGDTLSLPAAFRNRILVVVQMAGGNDGLNTLVPYANGRYYDARPAVGIAERDVLPLNSQFGLHPSLAKLKELWDAGVLAVVQGVGYPNPNLSHFRSMEIWQTANLEESWGDGWLGRYFERVIDEEGHLMDGVAVGNVLPMALRATGSEVAVVRDLETYQIKSDPGFPEDAAARLDVLLDLYASYPVKVPYAALLANVANSAYKSSETLQAAVKAYQPAVDYPDTPIGNGFRLLSQAISQDLGVRVFHIGLGGFDTHASQSLTQGRLLRNLAEGVHAFYRDLEAHDKAQDVLVLTWSEFGRRVQENANSGTDHGTAAPLFLLGGQVQKGIYGETPSLSTLQSGNLRYTVDFRSVYASVLDNWLGAPSEEILGHRYERLPLVASAVGR